MCWDGSSDGQNNQRARTALRSEDFGGEFVGRHKNQYGWCISCAASSGVLGCVGMEVVMDKITNAPELLSRLREVGRGMALAVPSAADEVRLACRALVQTTAAESAEIAVAGQDLAKAVGGVGDSASSSLRLHLRLQTLVARIQATAESSQAGRIWAAAQNLAELLL